MSYGSIEAAVRETVQSIRSQLPSRAYRSANELRNAAIDILSGQGGGRRYRIPHTGAYYTASAPGQPPAVRTGAFRNGWQPTVVLGGDTYTSRIENTVTVNGYILGELLENGTSKMAPRPHHEKIQDKAEPEILRIYSEPYF